MYNDDNIKYLENILNEYDSNKINSINKIFLNKILYNSDKKNSNKLLLWIINIVHNINIMFIFKTEVI